MKWRHLETSPRKLTAKKRVQLNPERRRTIQLLISEIEKVAKGEGILEEVTNLWVQLQDIPDEDGDDYVTRENRAVPELIQKLNAAGVRLTSTNPSMAKRLFQLALEGTTSPRFEQHFSHSRERLNLRVATLTNIACHFDRVNDIQNASKSLIKATEIETRLNQGTVSPETMISLGSLLSKMGRHNESVSVCKNAVKQIRKMQIRDSQQHEKDKQKNERSNQLEGGDWQGYLLATAWYNLGAAQVALEGGLKEQMSAATSSISFENAKKIASRLPATNQVIHLREVIPMSLPPIKSLPRRPILKPVSSTYKQDSKVMRIYSSPTFTNNIKKGVKLPALKIHNTNNSIVKNHL